MIRASSELLRKELRLQKTNAMFTIAVIILGVAALLTLRATGTEIGSFSVKDIKAGLFLAVLIPVLVLILPLMIGSTAAAAEKSMGVGAWQLALPVHQWQIIGVKIIVAGAGCAIVAGALPYLLQHWAQLDGGDRLYGLFRSTWTGWVGLLCGAIGFYGGSLARDDYQGLLVSVVPLGAVGLLMWLADPALLVLPAFGPEFFWKEWALVVRLGVIAAAFIFFAGGLLRYSGQFRWRQVAGHALALSMLIFGMTLWNVVTERSLLSTGQSRLSHISTSWAHTVHSTPAQITPLARVVDDETYRFTARLELHDFDSGEKPKLQFGRVSRQYFDESRHYLRESQDRVTHWFTVQSNREVREFPQAIHPNILGWTKNGRWLWTGGGAGMQSLSGPLGLSISSAALPDGWFNRLRNRIGIIPTPASDRSLYTGNKWLAEHYDNDVVVSGMHGFGVAWQDIRDAVPGNKLKDVKLGTRPFNRVTAWYVDEKGTTITAILRPASGPGAYKLAGWGIGDVLEVSDDYKWALINTTSSDAYEDPDRATKVVSISPDLTTDSVEGKNWTIPPTRSLNDGTTLVLFGLTGQLPIVELGGREYLAYKYRKVGPVRFGDRLIDHKFPFESGMLFFDLETGKESMLNMAPPWPMDASLGLQGLILDQFMAPYRFTIPTGDINHLGDLYLAQGNALVVQSNTTDLLTRANKFVGPPDKGTLPHVGGVYVHFPNSIKEVQFLNDEELLVSDGQTLWVVRYLAGSQRKSLSGTSTD